MLTLESSWDAAKDEEVRVHRREGAGESAAVQVFRFRSLADLEIHFAAVLVAIRADLPPFRRVGIIEWHC